MIITAEREVSHSEPTINSMRGHKPSQHVQRLPKTSREVPARLETGNGMATLLCNDTHGHQVARTLIADTDRHEASLTISYWMPRPNTSVHCNAQW